MLVDENNDFSHIDQQANELINQFGTGEAPAMPELPEKLAGIDRTVFEKALEEASGGKLNGKSFYQVIDIQDKFQRLEAERNDLFQKANSDPFADPRIKQMNEMLRNGAKEEELENYWALQKIDVTKLDELDAVRRQMQFENPELTTEDINNLLEEKYGSSDLEEIEGSKKTKLKLDAKDAKEALAKLQHKSKEPESVRVQRGEQNLVQTYHKNWAGVLEKAYGGRETYDLSIAVPNGKETKTYVISQKLDAEDRKLLLGLTAQYAAQNKVNLTKENVDKIIEPYMKQLVMLKFGEQLLAHAIQNSEAITKQQTLKTVHNNAPRTTTTPQTQKTLDGLAALKQEIFEKGAIKKN